MNRILLILTVLVFSTLGCSNNSISKNEGWVFDQEHVLTEDQENILNEIIVNFENETTNEIVIVTTDNIGEYKKMSFYAAEMGNQLGVGKKEKDNGLIIVFSSALSKTFIATGLSTEHILTDKVCKQIIDVEMVPEFRKGDIFKGLQNGLEECIEIWNEKKEN